MSQKQHHKDDDNQTENGMVRGLQNRHVQLIAIAGTIGTGLFLGAGRSLSLTGPSIILVYILTGIFMYLMMRAIGEMLYMDPDQHTFINLLPNTLVRAGDSSRVGLTGYHLFSLEWQKLRPYQLMSNIGSQVGLPGRFRLSSCLS